MMEAKMVGTYEIIYKNGDRENLDTNYVWQYNIGEGVNHGLNFFGTGCGLDYLVSSIFEGKPIIVAKNSGRDDINKVINTHDIRYIRQQVKDETDKVMKK